MLTKFAILLLYSPYSFTASCLNVPQKIKHTYVRVFLFKLFNLGMKNAINQASLRRRYILSRSNLNQFIRLRFEIFGPNWSDILVIPGRPACPAPASAVVTAVLQVVVDVADHVLDGLVAPLRVQRVLDRVGRLDEVVHVDARPLDEQAPEDARQVEEERLDEEEDGKPLVVAEVLLDGARLPGHRAVR